MHARLGQLLGAMVFALGSSWAQAQTMAPALPAPAGAADDAVRTLERRVTAMEGKLTAIDNAVQNLRSLPQQLDDIRQAIAAGQNGAAALPAERRDDVVRRRDFEALRDAVYEQEKMLGQVMRRNPGTGAVVLDMARSAQDANFRQDLNNAIQQAAPRDGWLVLENNMTAAQPVRVNGRDYTVAPATALNVPVPIGTATTELPGAEGVRTWTVAAPTYTQRVIISPKPGPVVVLEPTYVW